MTISTVVYDAKLMDSFTKTVKCIVVNNIKGQNMFVIVKVVVFWALYTLSVQECEIV